VNPIIAGVILVLEQLESASLQAVELDASGIDADHAAAVAVDRVFTAPDLKTVQMLIVPTEGDLQCLMELSDGAIASHQ
jgi:predicted secreted protein